MTAGEARALLGRLGEFLDHFAGCFGGRRARHGLASQYVQALLNDSERKSMQAMHGRMSEADSYQTLQHFITHAPWDTDAGWTRLRAVLPVRRGVLMLDETALPKHGTHSVAVARQYCGALGKLTTCQIVVSTALLAEGQAWPLTMELYLPEEWADDDARRTRADIPPTLTFREKWRIGLAHIDHLRRAGLAITGVVADADYGRVAPLRRALDDWGLRYALAVRGDQVVWTPHAKRTRDVRDVMRRVPADAWHRITWAQGVKGPLAARFAALRVRPRTARTECWLLCQRPLGKTGEWKAYFSNLPPTASLRELVRLARSRWPIEQQYRELKDELGFDHFEGRSYVGWRHHALLAAIAFTFLQRERRTRAGPLPTLPQVRNLAREIMLAMYVAEHQDLFDLIVSFRRNPPLRN